MISCLLLVVYRNGNRVRQQEELQNQLQTISQLLDANNNTNTNRQDEPIEPPPIYEVNKIKSDEFLFILIKF